MAPREVSHTPHRALGWAAMGAVLFQVGDQAAEVWDRSLGPAQMATSSLDPPQGSLSSKCLPAHGAWTAGRDRGFLTPRVYVQVACAPAPETKAEQDFSVPLAYGIGTECCSQCLEAFRRRVVYSGSQGPRTQVP